MKRNLIVFSTLILLIMTSCSISNTNNSSTKIPTNSIIVSTILPTNSISTKIPVIDATQEWINQEIESGKEQGEIIIAAIEKYYSDHGYYPEELDVLVPEYIEEIPLTITGQEYFYSIFDQHIYLLKFDRIRKGKGNIVYYCGYIRNLDEWECGSYIR